MKLSDNGLKLIEGFEGYHRALPDGGCAAYRCQIGNGMDDGRWTCGYGCTEGVTEATIWTKQQADEAFRAELSKFEDAVTRLVTVDLNVNQADAVISFAYNCGEGALKGSTLLRRLNAGDYEGAAAQFGNWTRSRGIVVSGLVRRRAAEAALFRTPIAASPQPDMPQSVTPPSFSMAHASAHIDLQQNSQLYQLQGLFLKLLGLPASGGIVGLASMPDPGGALSSVTAFARTYGVRAVCGIIGAAILIEGAMWLQRRAHL